MKAIIFLGTQKSGSSREGMKTSARLGYFTILFTNRMSQMRQRNEYDEVDQMVLCDIDNYEILKNRIAYLKTTEIEIEAIVSFIDPYVYIASKLADELGIGFFTTDAILKMQDKILSRKCLKDTNYAPVFKVLEKGKPYSINSVYNMLPLIMKNPNSTGSKDVYLIHTLQEFLDKLHFMMNIQNTRKVIIEQYLVGTQYIVETVVINNEVNIIALIEQEISLYNGHSIIVGYNLKHNSTKEFEESLKKAVTDIINFHGMKNGTCHLEMRYVKNNWKLIEINPRISGGAMNNIIKYGLGINLVEETIKFALRQEINITPKYQMYTFAKYITCEEQGILERVSGRNGALKSNGVITVFIKPRRGTILYPPISMGNRYAYVIANGLSEFGAIKNAKDAANKIKFHLE